MDAEVVETPWGNLEFGRDAFSSALGEGRVETVPVAVETAIGRAETTFIIDDVRDGVPERLRLLMYGGHATALAKSAPRGTSTLTSGGAWLGWRAQARLDPLTGTFAEDGGISVSFVDDATNRPAPDPVAEARVREAVRETVEAARAADPGAIARLYAALLGPQLADYDEDVARAERRAADLRALRDLARGRVEAALERAGTQAGPRP